MDKIQSLNQKVYEINEIQKIYLNREELQKPERVIFDNLKNKIFNKKILDIGVGGGRTTKYLLEYSNDYVAIDYSDKMISGLRKKFPNVKAYNCDAGNMTIFKDEEFYFILFSFNGIDYCDDTQRKKILKEIYRVLQYNGYFVFSSHNANKPSFNKDAPEIHLELNVFSNLKNIFRFIKESYYVYKNKKCEVFEEDYSIINDSSHRYRLLTYHLTIEKQINQLINVGFNNVEAYNLTGNKVELDNESNWIYYVCQK